LTYNRPSRSNFRFEKYGFCGYNKSTKRIPLLYRP